MRHYRSYVIEACYNDTMKAVGKNLNNGITKAKLKRLAKLQRYVVRSQSGGNNKILSNLSNLS